MKYFKIILFFLAFQNSFVMNKFLYARGRFANEGLEEKTIDFNEPNDNAFMAAMDKDPSFGVGSGRSQTKAITVWEDILKREDISDEQRLFATWRIASLCGYNYDPDKGEHSDSIKSVKLFKEVMNMIPGIISHEIVNSATLYATDPVGTYTERASRLVESYKFLKLIKDDDISNSADRVNMLGRIIDKRFFRYIGNRRDSSKEEKIQLLNKISRDGLVAMDKAIDDFLKYCTDDSASLIMLNQLQEVVTPEELEKWRNIRKDFYLNTSINEAAIATLENIKNTPFVINPIINQTENSIEIKETPEDIESQSYITEKIVAEQNSGSNHLILLTIAVFICLGIVGCFTGHHYLHKTKYQDN